MSKIKLFIFPGILEEAQICGDLDLADTYCPYCESKGSCCHLVACIDPLNYDVGGRLHKLDREFSYRIKERFSQLLQNNQSAPTWDSEEISEMWDWAKSNWEDGCSEVAVDEDVLFRLISTLLQNVASHWDIASKIEGSGVETEYTIIYDDDPERVLSETIKSLDAIL